MPTLHSNWDAHPGQEEIRQSDARFRIIACGRRWGKTKLAAHELFEESFESPDTLNWWVAPDYRVADIGYEKVKSIIPEGFIRDIKRSKPKRIDLENDSKIEFRSAGKEDGLVGEGINFLVIDECSMVPERAWKKEMRPTLSDTMGRMLGISTPSGRNWFYDYFKRGQSDDPEYDDVASWQASTYDNPHVPNSEVDAAKRELPERIFRQEYLAEFIDDSGGVFERVRERIVDDYDWRAAVGEPPYHIGVDFARMSDWTVITVLDGTGTLVHYWRRQQCPWPTIQRAVEAAYQQFEGRCYVDGSRDNKIVSDLQQAGIPVTPVKFTTQKKTQMVENLITSVEQEAITIPEIPQIISEMQAFEYDVTAHGNVRYHAPDDEGFFDDCVDSLALANWARTGAGRKRIKHRGKRGHVAAGSWLSELT